MCTVSVITTPHGYRLVHSRDEQHTRAPAAPPTIDRIADHRVILPRDPDAGGTWIALRDDGTSLAIMNVNPEPAPALDRSQLRSRGSIIPALLPRPEPWSRDDLSAIDTDRFAPFRLIVVDPSGSIACLTWRRDDKDAAFTAHETPTMWMSSGLGDSFVEPRAAVFEKVVVPEPTPAAQDAFHRHTTPGMGYASVLMHREQARTVGITTLDVSPGRVAMRYEPVDPDMRIGGAIDQSLTRSARSSMPF